MFVRMFIAYFVKRFMYKEHRKEKTEHEKEKKISSRIPKEKINKEKNDRKIKGKRKSSEKTDEHLAHGPTQIDEGRARLVKNLRCKHGIGLADGTILLLRDEVSSCDSGKTRRERYISFFASHI